ncbi:ComEA family DNA-binding protein [Modicisalibacter xianhensis]|uniref:Competence protein ComEA n=1 Tax=Modicisalibacter xianhensis TaxID=442341 RepID=A0A1I3AG33_9GAMM|nr:ComEA family DNA-binding protein [Halomonas xianhensis]TDX30226.1 competence protein ComEA [Halomonas xianhensis]SFH48301.1 competence protein ComEA [Halomonas xianhensis]
MKSLLKVAIFSLLLGSASLAMAQEATVNINTADVETLSQLPGIGATKAQAIVEDRTANGPFASVEELDRVNGIGAATIEGLRAQAGT